MNEGNYPMPVVCVTTARQHLIEQVHNRHRIRILRFGVLVALIVYLVCKIAVAPMYSGARYFTFSTQRNACTAWANFRA